MTLRGIILVIIAAGMMASASLMLRAGIDRAGGFGTHPGRLVEDILNLLRQPIFLIGVFLYGSGTLVWMRVISSEPLSLGYPVLVSVSFVAITLGAAFFFKEPLSIIKVIGMVVILVGVLVVSNG
jgi:multidrug transporter EmrE-like cation transporter